MKRLLTLLLLVSASSGGGCGAQRWLLGTESDYLFIAADAVTLPNQEVQLRARLQGGDALRPMAGQVVRFFRDDRLFKAAETDDDGVATVSFTPDQAGDFHFRADVAPAGLPDEPPEPQGLLVACRNIDSLMVVVDLDKTVVASGFGAVLIGDPDPMTGSVDVLERLARTYTILYLTHRPDYFSIKSKKWLKRHGYPPGPVLLSTLTGFFKGSGSYKTDALRDLRVKFEGLTIGIGDKISDAAAYHDNGLKAFLIVQIPDADDHEPYENLANDLRELDNAVQVVTSWDQIAKSLFDAVEIPRDRTERQLRETARRLRNDKATR